METTNPYVVPFLTGHLQDVNLDGADLSGSMLYHFGFVRVSMNRANVAWVYAWESNFQDVSMNDVFMEDCQLRVCGLRNVSLVRSTLTRLDFSGFLEDVDFSECRLAASFWRSCHASDVRLSAADLTYCTLRNCDFTGVAFDSASLNKTAFIDVQLKNCVGLDKVAHLGPSTFTLSTIQGNPEVPLEFWKLAGLDARVIDALGKPRDGNGYRSCFMSYASQDSRIVQNIFDFLSSKGVPCFKAPESLEIGASTRDAIYQAIADRDCLLVVLSQNSISSNWVEHEVERALAKERESKTHCILPIRIDIRL